MNSYKGERMKIYLFLLMSNYKLDYRQFQLSIARRMIEGRLNTPTVTNESSRTTLSKLQSSKVKTSRVSKESAGVLPIKRSDSKVSNFSVPKFQVYQEVSLFIRSNFIRKDYFIMHIIII